MSLKRDISRLLGNDDAEIRARFQEDLLTSLLVMAWMVEARDPYTGGHLWRVSRFARLLAADAGLREADVARIAVGGFLHDLGKISVPDQILGKQDRLTDQEYDVIKIHPEIGWRLLAGHPLAALGRAGRLVTVPTGRMGTAKDLEPEADTELIAGFVRESARALLAA